MNFVACFISFCLEILDHVWNWFQSTYFIPSLIFHKFQFSIRCAIYLVTTTSYLTFSGFLFHQFSHEKISCLQLHAMTILSIYVWLEAKITNYIRLYKMFVPNSDFTRNFAACTRLLWCQFQSKLNYLTKSVWSQLLQQSRILY